MKPTSRRGGIDIGALMTALGVAEALNGTSGSPHPDDADRIRTRLVRQLEDDLPVEWTVTHSADGPFDFAIASPRKRIAVALRHTSFPLDSATLRLIVISLSVPTELAGATVDRDPGRNRDRDRLRLGAGTELCLTRRT